MQTLPIYVLITPARNEAQYIELTLKSMVSQTVRPLRWIIVSDGSTDGTDEIVARYAADHAWIELVRTPERKERNFAGKVLAFNAGYAKVRDLDYDVIGCMDGDVSFDEDYFSFLLQKLAADSSLGLVGTPFKDCDGPTYDYRFVSIEHVSGICQLFRRSCFEQIGGYIPVKGGGIDLIAVMTARMKGWKTRTFPEKICLHHRTMGTAQNRAVVGKFKAGIKDYVLGAHPVWEMFRSLYQTTKPPVVSGGIALAAGYTWALIQRKERPISNEMVVFRRAEEMQRLKKFLNGNRGRRSQPASVPSANV